MHLHLLSISLLLLLTTSATAQTILMADQMIDVVKEEVVSNPVIVIEDGRITQILSGVQSLNKDADIINLQGMTLVPGMIDMHTHLTADAREHGYERLATSVIRSAIKGVKHAKQTLYAGVTTVRNLGAEGYADIALRDAINDGEVEGPRMFVSGPGLGVTGGHCDSNLLPPEYEERSDGIADGPWEVAKMIRKNIKYGVNVIKFCATGGVLSKGTKVGVQQYSLEEMKVLVDEAHRRGLIVAAHAHGTEGINDAIRAGVDSIEHASFIDDEGIKLAKRNGTHLSMDIYVTEYILGEGEAAGILEESLEKERMTGKTQRENFKKAHKAGINMVMGTDAGVYPHGDNLKQLARMVRFGMSPMEALQAASINAAKLLRQENNIGSISAGRYADIIAVKGNPLDDISVMENVGFVMKEGTVYVSP